eukprot:gene5716-6609_t
MAEEKDKRVELATVEEQERYLEDYMRDLQNTPYVEQKRRIGQVVDHQIKRMFEQVAKEGGSNSYPPPIDKLPMDSREARLRRALLIREENRAGAVIEHPDGFKIRISRSMIDHQEAGYGVHVEGEVAPGTVLGFYAGDTYAASDVPPTVARDNDYMIARYDGTVIDGRAWLRRAEIAATRPQMFAATGATTDAANSMRKFRNPFALGPFINHPSLGQRPNVIGIGHNFMHTFPDPLKPYIPNQEQTRNKLLSDQNVYLRSFLVMAYEPLKDCELLLNYRFNPDNAPYPSWYHQPDEEEAKRRWGETERFSLRTIADRLS